MKKIQEGTVVWVIGDGAESYFAAGGDEAAEAYASRRAVVAGGLQDFLVGVGCLLSPDGEVVGDWFHRSEVFYSEEEAWNGLERKYRAAIARSEEKIVKARNQQIKDRFRLSRLVLFMDQPTNEEK